MFNHLDGSASDRVITQKLGNRSIQAHIIVRRRNLKGLRTSTTSTGPHNKTAMRIVNAEQPGAGLHSFVQSRLVRPSVYEHSVQTIPSRIAHCVNEFVVVVEFRGVVVELIEEGVDCYWMRSRTYSVVISAYCRVGDLFKSTMISGQSW